MTLASKSGGASLTGGKKGNREFTALKEPKSTRAKHPLKLENCGAVVFMREGHTNEFWGREISKKLATLCKQSNAHCLGKEGSLTRDTLEGALNAAKVAIVFISFYKNQEYDVETLIGELKQQQIGHYVVIASALPSMVPKGICDLVLDKNQLLSDKNYLQNELNKMLLKLPLSVRHVEK